MKQQAELVSLLKRIGYRIASAFAFKPEEWTRADVVRMLFSIALFFSSVIALDRWWQWNHHLVGLHSPILWSLAALVILLLAPNRPEVVVFSLGFCVFYGLKGAILDKLLLGWAIAVVAFALALVIVGVFPSAFEKYSSQRIGWGFRWRKDD